MLLRKAATVAVATLAIALSSGAVLAAPAPEADAVPDAPATSSLEDSTEEAEGAALWVGVVTGVSGVAALAFSVRRPRTSDG